MAIFECNVNKEDLAKDKFYRDLSLEQSADLMLFTLTNSIKKYSTPRRFLLVDPMEAD